MARIINKDSSFSYSISIETIIAPKEHLLLPLYVIIQMPKHFNL